MGAILSASGIAGRSAARLMVMAGPHRYLPTLLSTDTIQVDADGSRLGRMRGGAQSLLQAVVEKWNAKLSSIIQLAPQKGVYADDLDLEVERLYGEQVAPPRPGSGVGAPGSRLTMRRYCSQVWMQARFWERIEKSVRVQEFTFPGDPMRFDYGYRHNGTGGFEQLLSVTRSPKDGKEDREYRGPDREARAIRLGICRGQRRGSAAAEWL